MAVCTFYARALTNNSEMGRAAQLRVIIYGTLSAEMTDIAYFAVRTYFYPKTTRRRLNFLKEKKKKRKKKILLTILRITFSINFVVTASPRLIKKSLLQRLDNHTKLSTSKTNISISIELGSLKKKLNAT